MQSHKCQLGHYLKQFRELCLKNVLWEWLLESRKASFLRCNLNMGEQRKTVSFFVVVALSLWMLEKEYFLTQPQTFSSPLKISLRKKYAKYWQQINESHSDLIHILSSITSTLNTLLSWRRVFFQERLIRKRNLVTWILWLKPFSEMWLFYRMGLIISFRCHLFVMWCKDFSIANCNWVVRW